jgi:hypothetical protein
MTKSDRNGLSIKQQKALPILASSSNYDDACQTAGISRGSYYRWLKQPLFKSELERLRNEIVGNAMNSLKSSAHKAVDTLVGLMDKKSHPGIQRAAANDVLNHMMKYKELSEFEERLQELERRFPPIE